MIIKIQYFLKRTGETLLALIKIIFLSGFRPGIRYQQRKNDCVVLVNGPSLNILVDNHRDFLKDRKVFCVNFFPLTPLYEQLKPEYFIISAPELWLEDVDEVYVEKSRQTFDSLNTKTSWPLKLLIPFAAKTSGSWKSRIASNRFIEVIYYNDTGIEGFRNLVFWFYKRKLAIPRPHNVLVPALMNAINLGYRKIYLWGAENDQFKDITVTQDNIALISQKHFYDKAGVTPKTMKKLGKGQRKVHEILHKFMLSFEAYHVINDYAVSRGARIINQTPGSMIDAFERESIG